MIHLRTYMKGEIGDIVIPIVVSTTSHDELAISHGHPYATAVFLGRSIGDSIDSFERNEFDGTPYQEHLKVVRHYEQQGFRKLRSEVDSGIALVA